MRNNFKIIIGFIFMALVLPLYLLYFVVGSFSNKDSLFYSFSQFLSLFPGKLGSYLRIAFYRLSMTYCHQNIVISFASIFSQHNTTIEEGVYIGPQCNIGMCEIGKNSLIASGVHIMSGKNQHKFDDLSKPIQQQGGSFEKVKIGEDCWIGNGSLVMANIGNKCIIGAGSVVTSDIPDFSVAVGNPAKIVKKRG